jgi:hypothetical protein
VLAAVRARDDGHRDNDQPGKKRHRPYLRSISARTWATSCPAAAMRDASSASFMQMSQVGAWPSV